MTNLLADATSPYLLQHADNPVHWRPWGREAFDAARQRNVPVLLSVGYAACHWCHVMAHESFENPQIAVLMNESFVSVKVDREERPDVDAVYMDAVTAMTGQGGWPMTVFLTPEGEPFYAGTYFPPQRRGEMPGFPDVLRAVSGTWRDRADDVRDQAAAVLARIDQLREDHSMSADGGPLSAADCASAVDVLVKQYDYARGGFGGTPKFPPSMVLEFLARHHARTGSADALLMAEGTLRAMAGGGIYDQLVGGFARYSVDADWVVPHFEKMLYDNALLARVALHVGQVSGRPLGARVAEETADFLVADLGTAEGGFASALDADTEGVEGRYYVWTPDQLVDVLGDVDGRWAAELLEVTDEGTFEDGSSTLQLRTPPDDPERWQRVRERLALARSTRVKPARDDKVVTAWNGMAIAALAEIGAARRRSELIAAAVRCGELLWRVHWTGERLLRVSRDGEPGTAHGVLEDYAWVCEGWLVLYQVTGDLHWFARAVTVLDAALAAFPDSEGAFFDTASDAEELVRRPREWTDNATPCGQSALASATLTAAAL
ncbi:MAG: thioredoxin domain-containing protein, partial [Actinomycetes bacterium]